MDSLTHIVLGAAVGELVAGKKLGKRSWLAGAFLQTVPDFDFIAGLWCNPAEDLLAHRGFTHSFFFIVLVASLFSWGITRTKWGSRAHLNFWLTFVSVELLVHVLLDGFNVYGTAWFEPFAHQRVSFDVLFVADPFLTIPLVLGVFWIIFFLRSRAKRIKTVLAVLSYCLLYISYGSNNKLIIEGEVKRALVEKQINYDRYLITPTPFNTWLWYIIIERKDDFLIGYRSVFDTTSSIQLTSTPKKHEWLQGLKPREHPNNNKFLIQRGRVQGWSLQSAQKFAQRIFHAN